MTYVLGVEVTRSCQKGLPSATVSIARARPKLFDFYIPVFNHQVPSVEFIAWNKSPLCAYTAVSTWAALSMTIEARASDSGEEVGPSRGGGAVRPRSGGYAISRPSQGLALVEALPPKCSARKRIGLRSWYEILGLGAYLELFMTYQTSQLY